MLFISLTASRLKGTEINLYAQEKIIRQDDKNVSFFSCCLGGDIDVYMFFTYSWHFFMFSLSLSSTSWIYSLNALSSSLSGT